MMKNLYDGTTVASPCEAPSAFAVVHAHQKPTQPPAGLICEPGLLPDPMQYAVLVSAHRKENCLRDDPMQCKCTTSEPGTFRHPWGPVPATQTRGLLDVGNGPRRHQCKQGNAVSAVDFQHAQIMDHGVSLLLFVVFYVF